MTDPSRKQPQRRLGGIAGHVPAEWPVTFAGIRIIIDDFGLASLTEQQKQDLLETIEERYGTGATIITSQLPVADWHEYLGGGRIADAILDRVVHNSHRIDLASKDSMRINRPDLPHAGQSAI